MTEWKNNDFFTKTVHVNFIVGTLQLTGMEPDDLCERGEGMVGEEYVRTKHGPGVHRPRILDPVNGPPQLGPCPRNNKN